MHTWFNKEGKHSLLELFLRDADQWRGCIETSGGSHRRADMSGLCIQTWRIRFEGVIHVRMSIWDRFDTPTKGKSCCWMLMQYDSDLFKPLYISMIISTIVWGINAERWKPDCWDYSILPESRVKLKLKYIAMHGLNPCWHALII